MNIGVFFGSFNPIHLGHIGIAKAFLKDESIDEVWLSVSPQNPWKEAQGLAPMAHRVAMTTLATSHFNKIKVLDFEKDLPQPSYTYEALLELEKQYPNHYIKLLIGGDNCQLFNKWRNYDKILKRFGVLAYPREGAEIPQELEDKMTIVRAPLLDFASTNIRASLKNKEDVSGIDPSVLRYIMENDIYT